MIELKDLTVKFKKRGFIRSKTFNALDDFNLNVDEGDIFALLGPNGAGKSTSMYCMLGLISPDEGSVNIFGQQLYKGSSLFDKIAYLPEEPHYHLYLSVFEAVKFYTSLYTNNVSDSKILEVLDRLGLSDFYDLQLKKCSKGMKQKAGIAVCMLSEAPLIFLDEPTRGLDPLIVKEFRDILIDLNQQGSTIVLNSHILSEVESICNKVAIIDKGKVVVQDDLNNLIRLDKSVYSVQIDITENIPDYVKLSDKIGNYLKCEVVSDRLSDFLNFINSNGLTLYECSHKKVSLEQVMHEIINKNKDLDS